MCGQRCGKGQSQVLFSQLDLLSHTTGFLRCNPILGILVLSALPSNPAM